MKYKIPETTFEDQIYSLYKNLSLTATANVSAENIYKEDKFLDTVSIYYRPKYLHVSLFGADFAVSSEDFEEGIFNAFKSHAFCMTEQDRLSHIESIAQEIIVSTTTYAYGNKELQEKRFEYFKSLVNAINRIIEDKEIPYPGSLFKIALLHRINETYLTEPKNKMKDSLLYFSNNITKNKENNTDLNHKYDVQNSSASAFLNYLMVLTQFNTEQKELKNLVWDEFNVINSKRNAHYLTHVINMYTLAKINFNIIDKDVLLDKISVDYLMEFRGKLSGKSKIKDGLTTFLEPLTTEKQKKYMFLQSVLNKALDNKYVLIEKKYYPDLISLIEEEDIESVFKEGFFYSPSLEKIISDETNFMVKILGLNYDYGLTEKTARTNNLVFLKPVIVEAFKAYNIKEDKKALKKAIGIVKKTKPKERI